MNISDIHVGDYVWFNKNTICGRVWDDRSPEVVCEVIGLPSYEHGALIRPLDLTIDIAPWQPKKTWVQADGSFCCSEEYLSPCGDLPNNVTFEIDISSLL